MSPKCGPTQVAHGCACAHTAAQRSPHGRVSDTVVTIRSRWCPSSASTSPPTAPPTAQRRSTRFRSGPDASTDLSSGRDGAGVVCGEILRGGGHNVVRLHCEGAFDGLQMRASGTDHQRRVRCPQVTNLVNIPVPTSGNTNSFTLMGLNPNGATYSSIDPVRSRTGSAFPKALYAVGPRCGGHRAVHEPLTVRFGCRSRSALVVGERRMPDFLAHSVSGVRAR